MRYPLARRTVLEHPVRRAILDAVEGAPGLTTAALAQRLRADWKTVAHHTRVLAALGHLDELPDGRARRFYPVHRGGAAPRAAVATAAARVLARALARPGLTLPELRDALGMPISTARWHVVRLAEKGLLAPAGAGWAVPPGQREAVRQALGAEGPRAE